MHIVDEVLSPGLWEPVWFSRQLQKVEAETHYDDGVSKMMDKAVAEGSLKGFTAGVRINDKLDSGSCLQMIPLYVQIL